MLPGPALLTVAVVLVETDSAMYTEQLTGGLCGDDSTTVTTYHVWPLYPFCGAALLTLLRQTWCGWTDARQ